MAQYMEFQMARPVRGTALHEQFMKLNLPEFMGTTDPLVAEEWLKKLDAIFEVMEYFPRIYRMQKEQEFMSLKKRTMSVVAYEEKFTALSRFVPKMNRREHFKKRRFDSGTGPSRQRSSDVTTTEQSRAQTDVGSARPGNSRGEGSSRGRGSWRPPVRPNTARSGTTRGIVCYRCGVEVHMVRDCPMPWVDKCYQCGQPGHIARHCTQGPVAASSVGSAVGGGRGANRNAQQGQTTTPEPRAQARVYAMTQKDSQTTPNAVTGTLLVNNEKAYVLIDPGATHSFVSTIFCMHLD
ncbi:uncharacterized protein LOC130768977 [Actinidia eriantha]|uniref:uncharacterized protein LOC130768977 n=1 Tax=Actinidia eriantha TaxID=165200 RepID=UPI0025874970|nr:uncharacterized protein LOC130768977 [Actinidia eriantha]